MLYNVYFSLLSTDNSSSGSEYVSADEDAEEDESTEESIEEDEENVGEKHASIEKVRSKGSRRKAKWRRKEKRIESVWILDEFFTDPCMPSGLTSDELHVEKPVPTLAELCLQAGRKWQHQSKYNISAFNDLPGLFRQMMSNQKSQMARKTQLLNTLMSALSFFEKLYADAKRKNYNQDNCMWINENDKKDRTFVYRRAARNVFRCENMRMESYGYNNLEYKDERGTNILSATHFYVPDGVNPHNYGQTYAYDDALPGV